MATIKKNTVSGNEYYYLEHSMREGGKVVKKVVYLGKDIPGDIDKRKRAFMLELYKEKWFSKFEMIKKNYAREQKAKPPSARLKEMQAFATRFTYDTQRIEGSSLTLRETANLLEHGITPNEKPIGDIYEAEAHRQVFYEMLDYRKDLSLQVVLFWHKRLFEKTKPGIAGRIRNYRVGISGSNAALPLPAELDFMLHEFFSWYNSNKGKMNPVELAALVHLKFVTIHPFGDGNGRISRLMMNFVLNKHGYPMLDITYVKRSSYYSALERSQTKGDGSPFLSWLFRRYLKEYGRLSGKQGS
jgi:Fic family protein